MRNVGRVTWALPPAAASLDDVGTVLRVAQPTAKKEDTSEPAIAARVVLR
jgi:hypothetical protein